MLSLKKNITFIFFIFQLTTSCYATNANCENWIISAVKSLESVPPKHRFKQSLIQINKACGHILSDKLKQAAEKSVNASVKERQSILQISAAPYFSESCLDTPPYETAEKLNHICLGEDFMNGPYTSMLSNIDVATYMYGKAIEKEFEKAGLNAQYAKKFILNYYLGAAVSLENSLK